MKLKKHQLIAMALLTVILVTAGCGRSQTAFDQVDATHKAAISDMASVDACRAANRLLVGNGLTRRGHTLYFKGVPLSVRDQELAQVLPNKDALRLAVKYDVLPTKEDIKRRLNDLQNDGQGGFAHDAASAMVENRMLCQMVEENAFQVWRKKVNPIARLRHREKNQEDWLAYLSECQEKNKTEIKVLQ